jgi:membrane associated rhomboid family serine protease
MVPASVGFQCPECVTEGRKNVRPAKTMYGGNLRRGGVDATRVLVVINVIIYLITAINAGSALSPDPNASIYHKFALVSPAIANGEWYRLFSSMFLHYNLIHIGFNMWALFVIGTPLEQMLGRWRYLLLYFLSGIGGGVLSMAFGQIGVPSAGASGAIFGLFGAFYVITRRRGLETGPIVGLIAINLVFSFTFSGIDWRGHVGGLIAGSAVAFAFAAARPGPNRDQMQVAGCVIIAVLLAASGLGAAQHVKSECKATSSARVAAACAEANLPNPFF